MDKEGRKQMIDEDGYILREVWSAKRIKIPDGYVNRDVFKTDKLIYYYIINIITVKQM